MSSVTPRERREVAKSLRYLAEMTGGSLENDAQFTAVLKYWIFVDFKRYSYDETLTRLANLIDPTCHQVIEDETQVCSECSEDLDEGYGWDFCPNCGARVVRDEA